MDAMDWTALGTVIIALMAAAQVFTAIVFSRSASRAQKQIIALQERLNWLAGAIESHSTMQLRIAARQAGLQTVWFDPTQEPIKYGRHMTEARIDGVRLFLPESLRQGQRKPAPEFAD